MQWYDFSNTIKKQFSKRIRVLYYHWCQKCGCDRGYAFKDKILRTPMCHACTMASEVTKSHISKSHSISSPSRYEKQKQSLLMTRVLRSGCSSVEEYRTMIKLKRNLRSRLNKALKGNYKTGSAVSDLGISIDDFKKYLESLWQPGMTWDNYGKNGWEIDHIKPLCSFDLTNPIHLLEACNYTNLQPLWKGDNLGKRQHDGTFRVYS